MDKTVKIRAYSDDVRSEAPQANLAKDKNISLEFAPKSAPVGEEKNSSPELLKTISLLRESLKQEQAKTADLEAKLNKLVELEEIQLARKNAQLEEEKNKSLEYLQTIELLRESIKQDQAKAATTNKSVELEAKSREVAMLEAKVKDLSGLLGKIASIAAAGKLPGNT